MTTFSPGTYRKGDDVRYADSAATAVNLAFTGYQRVTAESVAEGASYAELQAQAKSLGIPANGTKESLAQAIADFVPVEAPAESNLEAPELGEDSLLSGDSSSTDAPGEEDQ
jgi:hypothetical protein